MKSLSPLKAILWKQEQNGQSEAGFSVKNYRLWRLDTPFK
jgi:hypothetical protein